MGARVAQDNPETSADGIEFMDSTPKPLKATLEAIRDMASNALDQIDQDRRHVRCDGNAKSVGILRILRGLFHWMRPADAPDAKVGRLAITFSVFYRRGGETRFRRLSNN